MAQLTLVRTKVGRNGGGTFIHSGTRAKVVVSRKLFKEGVAPENLTFEVSDELMAFIAEDNPKYAGRPVAADSGDKIAKAQERVARAQERAAKAAEKAAKAAEKAEKLAAQIAEM